MKNESLFLLMLLILLALVACNTAGSDEPTVEAVEPGETTTVQQDVEPDADKVSVANCAASAPGVHQMIGAAQGICLIYPDDFNVFEYADGLGYVMYIESLVGNHKSPVIWITFEPADGCSLEEVTAQRLADYAFPDTPSQAIRLGGEPASMLDNLPGQDTQRRVVAVHEDRVIDIVIDHIGENYGAAGEQAVAVYSMITGSLQFIGIEPEAPLLAGPECPQPAESTMIYTNEPAGYCLLVPAAYAAQAVDPEGSETAFYVGPAQDVAHARLSIKVEDAGGCSLDEITADLEAEIESAMPGLDLMPSFGYMLDGARANRFDQVPGQDLSRQVVMLHNDRLLTLTFIPEIRPRTPIARCRRYMTW